MSYVETAADHLFTAFLAGLTPGKVRRDLSGSFSPVERKRRQFLNDKNDVERFTATQLRIAREVMERKAS